MPRLSQISNRPSTGHSGAALPPHTGGGGGGRGRGSGGDSLPNYGERLRRARLGLAIAMTPILMLFIAFTGVYLVRRGFVTFDLSNDAYVRTWLPVHLPWFLLLVNTGVLIVSTVTMELARRSITREAALAPVKSIPGVSLGNERHFPWLILTTALGLMFLAGQVLVWMQLSARGFHLAGSPSSSFVYVLTGMHALHLAGGVLALLFANLAVLFHHPVESRRIVVDVTGWYWHFMTGLWIYVLALFSFAAQ